MDETDTTQKGTDPSNEQEVRFKYIKSNFFRVIHADGAWGGISTRGDIHMSFYNERAALPDSSVLTLGPDGRSLKPEVVESSGGITREVECDVVFDLITAVALRRWLDDKINEMNQIVQEAQKQQSASKVKVS